MNRIGTLLAAITVVSFSNCKPTLNSYAISKEAANIKVIEKENAIRYDQLTVQQIPTLAERTENSRGLVIGPMMGGAVSLATSMVKKMIANDRKKYMAEYDFGLTDLYFYDQLSTESVFDPVGFQFSGFTLVRTFINKEGRTDTALIAQFAIDTTRPNEIINNSIFRLRLKELDLRYAKAKITKGQKNVLNMDFEITFTTSYVNDQGQLFDKITLGKFYYFLRNAPLDRKAEGYSAFYDKLKGQPLEGKSFIVPRSFGYYLASDKTPQRCFSQGAYSINVKVKETSKDKFVTKIIMDNSSQLIDALGGKAKDLLKKM